MPANFLRTYTPFSASVGMCPVSWDLKHACFYDLFVKCQSKYSFTYDDICDCHHSFCSDDY